MIKKMDRYLLSPVGFYMSRTLHSISEVKPDKIIFITSRDANWKDFQRELVIEIRKRLEMWTRTESVEILEWESMSQFEICLKDMLKTIDCILKENPNAIIYIDITSATRFFNIAAVNAAMLYRNVSLIYTPRSMTKSFRDLNPADKGDWGKEPLTIQLPYVPALEKFEKNSYLKTIIIALSYIGGEFSTLKNLLRNLNSIKERLGQPGDRSSNLVRLSRHVATLEEYGFVQTTRLGRRKMVKLTNMGQVLAKVFQEEVEMKHDITFDHIEAWLFYGPDISYKKGERNPKKNNPRSKLICNTKTKKAFFVDRDVWRMILNDQVRWHSDDEQNLEWWCHKMGYKLVKRDARLADLLDRRE